MRWTKHRAEESQLWQEEMLRFAHALSAQRGRTGRHDTVEMSFSESRCRGSSGGNDEKKRKKDRQWSGHIPLINPPGWQVRQKLVMR
jgi:hypothetical protein